MNIDVFFQIWSEIALVMDVKRRFGWDSRAGSKLINVCFEPKSFAVEIDTDNGKEFATTKLTTRQTYTLAFVEGTLDPSPITFKEQDGMDFAATTVKLPDGEYVPFLFTVKELVAKGEGSSFKPGFTWGGEFSVPSYRAMPWPSSCHCRSI